LLPLAYDPREWNAAFVAMHMAEYCGAPLIVFHAVVPHEEIDKEFREEVKSLARRLKIKIKVVNERLEDSSFESIARAIVMETIKQGAQGVVMAAHKEGFFKELVGRVSDRVALRNPTKTILVETPRPDVKIVGSPRKIVVLVKPGSTGKDAFVVTAALTSLATAPDADLIAAQAILLPQTVPLDALEYSSDIRNIERNFAELVSTAIKNLGRLFSPRVLAARELGKDIASFAAKEKADLLVLTGRRTRALAGLFGKDTKDIVANSPCVSLVVFGSES
jgi:nucleotide-binding universal stress UspA family protein